MKKISLYILILTIILNTSQVFANMAFNPWPGQYGVNSWGDNTYSYGNNYNNYNRKRIIKNRNTNTNNTVKNILNSKRLAEILGK